LGVVVHVLSVEGHQFGGPERPDEADQQQRLVPSSGQFGFGGTAGCGPRLGLRASLEP